MGQRLSKKILIIEDDADIRDLLSTFLEDEGYDVEQATTAEEGLKLLRLGGFELVVSDYLLPEADAGWMFEKAHVRGYLGDVKTLVITAHPYPRELHHVRGTKIMMKPLDLDAFLFEVKRLTSPRQAPTYS